MDKKKRIIILIIIVIGLLLIYYFNKEKGIKTYPVQTSTGNESIYNEIIVEIKGAVLKPGLYIVNQGARINDLVLLAGGFTNYANTDNLNMATKLTDGMLIFIEKKFNDTYDGKLSINTATIEELMQLPGIGESRASSIVEYRNKVGRFNTLEEIVNVNGISKNIFEQIKEYICL